MSDEPDPSDGGGREHVTAWAVVAVVLAVAGVAASLWRPLAPSLDAVTTDLDTFTTDVLVAVETYRAPRRVVAALATALGVVVPVLVAVSGPGRRLVERLAGPTAHAPLRAGLVALVVSAATSLATFPLSAWARIVHDGRWGFRTQSAASWVVDWVTVSGGRWLAVAVLAALLVTAMRRWPRSWPYRVTVLGMALATVIVVVHPLVLQPVLLPSDPLPDGETRQAAEEIAEQMGAGELPLHVGYASRRTTRVNAMVVGLGPTERIVLYDTLLEMPAEQVRTVLAHELAHREHRDLLRGVLAVPTALLVALLVVKRVAVAPRVQRLAGARGPTDPRLLAVIVALAAVLELVGAPVANLVSRRAEAAADFRGIEVTNEPGPTIAAARAFTVRDLSSPQPPTWMRVLYGTHPNVGERIRAAAAASSRDQLPDLEDLEAQEREVSHPAILDGPP